MTLGRIARESRHAIEEAVKAANIPPITKYHHGIFHGRGLVPRARLSALEKKYQVTKIVRPVIMAAILAA